MSILSHIYDTFDIANNANLTSLSSDMVQSMADVILLIVILRSIFYHLLGKPEVLKREMHKFGNILSKLFSCTYGNI